MPMAPVRRTFWRRLLLVSFVFNVLLLVKVLLEQKRPVAPTFIRIPSRSNSSGENFHDTEQFQYSSPIVIVSSAERLTRRVKSFNDVLDELRYRTWRNRVGVDGAVGNSNSQTSSLSVVYGYFDDYIDRLALHHNQTVTTVVIPWLSTGSVWNSLEDFVNVAVQRYYQWTADDRLCRWIETPGAIKMKYDVTFNRTCERDISAAISRATTLRPEILNGKPISAGSYWPNNGESYPPHFYTDTPQYVFHLHLYRQDAIVNGVGDVISGNTKLVLYTCAEGWSRSRPYWFQLWNAPNYDELYVISQYWGTGVFHRMVEVVPRIVFSIEFLRRNPDIRIHAPETSPTSRLGELLTIFGLDPRRLVSGYVRAKVVYQPRSTTCGYANVAESQLTSQLYAEHIRREWPEIAKARPNRLLLIKRSGSRRFSQQEAIEEAMKRIAVEFDLVYTLFSDDPTPSLNVTMQWFHGAALVVAPHGAGLSNIYFSRPGTFVIEGVCNIPHVNLCFQRLAHVLGHRWHGVTSTEGCESVVTVSPVDVESAVRTVLTFRKRSLSHRGSIDRVRSEQRTHASEGAIRRSPFGHHI